MFLIKSFILIPAYTYLPIVIHREHEVELGLKKKEQALPSTRIGTGAHACGLRCLSQCEGHPVGIHALPPVKVAPGQAVNQQLSCGYVGSHRDGMLVA